MARSSTGDGGHNEGSLAYQGGDTNPSMFPFGVFPHRQVVYFTYELVLFVCIGVLGGLLGTSWEVLGALEFSWAHAGPFLGLFQAGRELILGNVFLCELLVRMSLAISIWDFSCFS